MSGRSERSPIARNAEGTATNRAGICRTVGFVVLTCAFAMAYGFCVFSSTSKSRGRGSKEKRQAALSSPLVRQVPKTARDAIHEQVKGAFGSSNSSDEATETTTDISGLEWSFPRSRTQESTTRRTTTASRASTSESTSSTSSPSSTSSSPSSTSSPSSRRPGGGGEDTEVLVDVVAAPMTTTAELPTQTSTTTATVSTTLTATSTTSSTTSRSTTTTISSTTSSIAAATQDRNTSTSTMAEAARLDAVSQGSDDNTSSTVTSTTATTTSTTIALTTTESEWECYHWSSSEVLQMVKDKSQSKALCVRPRGDGYSYAWGHQEDTPCPSVCDCCRRWTDPARTREEIPDLGFAFVMMAYEAHGVSDITWGALAMAKALRQLSLFPLVLLSNTTEFPDGRSYVDVFAKLGARVIPVYPVELKSATGWTVDHWNIAFWKLQIFKLVQFDKLVWLDQDAILYRNVDWLFYREGMWAQRDAWFCDLDASAVCSGIISLSPNMADFDGLLDLFARQGSSITHGDQELIEKYFREVKESPVQLMTPLEASFGQCSAKPLSPVLLEDGTPMPGLWTIPAFVHKSGGWDNTVSNGYNNVCFVHDMQRQRYYIGDSVVNVCHYNPLAGYWRKIFCSAAKEGGLNVDTVNEFCNDHCYFKGEMRGDAECPSSVVMLTGPLTDDADAIPGFGEEEGAPAPRAVWNLAPYKFESATAHGTVESVITYHDAVLPPPPFTILMSVKSTSESGCMEIIGWFNERSDSVEIRMEYGNIIYGEKYGAELSRVGTSGGGLSNGEWQHVAISRDEKGTVQFFVGGRLKDHVQFPLQVPVDLSRNPRSERKGACYFDGEVQHFSMFNMIIRADVIAEIAL